MLSNPVGQEIILTLHTTLKWRCLQLQELDGKLNILTKYFERSNENAIEEQKEKSKSK
jgi:hypothetical protein